MDSKQLLHEVIEPTLKFLDMDSPAARNLILGTIAQESHMGKYLVQLGGGPALGVAQMEPATHDDIWDNYLKYRQPIVYKLDQLLCLGRSKHEQLKWNLAYAVAMARVHYRRVAAPLPDADDIEQLAHYWKDHYNTYAGKGTVEEFVHNYQRFVL